MIIVTPTGTLTQKQKTALEKKGLLVVECDDPDKVRVINAEQHMDTSDWFMAALFAVKSDPYQSRQFTTELYNRLKAKETTNTPTP